MTPITLLIIILVVLALCGGGVYGGHAGWYPVNVGYGGGLVTLILALVLLRILGLI